MTRIFCHLLTGKIVQIQFDHISNSPNILLLFYFLELILFREKLRFVDFLNNILEVITKVKRK